MAVNRRVFVSALFLASYAAAAPLCTSLTTLDAYIDTGAGGCQLGDKLFSNFSYGAGGTGVLASGVAVTTSSANGGLDLALTFTGNWIAAAAVGQTTQTTDVTLRFNVSAPSSLPMWQTGLSMTGQIFYTRPVGIIESVGKIQAGETVGPGAIASLSPAPITTSSSSPDSSIQTSSSSATFSDRTFLTVSKDLTLSSGGSTSQTIANNPAYQAESVKLISFTETFYERPVPEPAVFFTFGGGLLVLGLAGKRFMPATRKSASISEQDKNKNNSEAL
ncbi:MAG: hypothetical protein ABI759_00205 [Candidatus Solibacter sp.]